MRAGSGPLLAYHVSWHKPATPLLDGLQETYASAERASWLGANVELYIGDRGGAGSPTLEWAMSQGIPFLTVMPGSMQWTQYQHPRTHTPLGVPVFVRPDASLLGWQCFEGAPVPREIVFPAHPEKGTASTKALRYKSTAALNDADLQALDQLYKTRWPNNENAIKDLLSAGFDRNLDRTLVLSTSRGTDGKLARLGAQRGRVMGEIAELERSPLDRATRSKIATRHKKLDVIRQKSALLEAPPTKSTRAPRGAELLVKVLTMIAFNALRLVLARSTCAAIRVMSIGRVRELLLARSVVTVIEADTLRLHLEPIRDARERELQRQLVDVFNDTGLTLAGRTLSLALQPCARRRDSRRKRI